VNNPLLEVKELITYFNTPAGRLQVVDGISLNLHEQECFGNIGACNEGRIIFDSIDVLKLTEKELREYRGKKVAIILQDPLSALNPLYTVGNQMSETIITHQRVGKKEAIRQTKDLFHFLGIPEDRLNYYPFQLSGGMLQRIVGGIAISSRPKLIIADEPTTALDATVQLQYLQLLKKIQRGMNTAIILISHDLKVIAMMCSRVAVMYAGKIVEEADIGELIDNPRHPYTEALLRSANLSARKVERIHSIVGQPPQLLNSTQLCRFADRCVYCFEKCRATPPPKGGDRKHFVECWRAEL
jgi:peptide/nickel transport system ATP-binding protein